MNRAELQSLADIRVADAKVLLDAGRYQGAYYLLGYAVECALKACVAKQIREHDFPDRKLIQESYTHDLGRLLAISGLKAQFDARVAADSAFEVNWSAVTDNAHGILTWLKTLW